jgi:hypothetical protein
VGGRGRPPPRAAAPGGSPLAGRAARRGGREPRLLRRGRARAPPAVLPPARPGRPRSELDLLARPAGGVHHPPGPGQRHARPDRQRGVPAPATRDRRAGRADPAGGRRQHHHAAQAQPRVRRASGHALAAGPGHGRDRPGEHGAGARARRPRLEGRMGRLPRGVPAHRDRARPDQAAAGRAGGRRAPDGGQRPGRWGLCRLGGAAGRPGPPGRQAPGPEPAPAGRSLAEAATAPEVARLLPGDELRSLLERPQTGAAGAMVDEVARRARDRRAGEPETWP